MPGGWFEFFPYLFSELQPFSLFVTILRPESLFYFSLSKSEDSTLQQTIQTTERCSRLCIIPSILQQQWKGSCWQPIFLRFGKSWSSQCLLWWESLYPELTSLQGGGQDCIQLERCSSVVDLHRELMIFQFAFFAPFLVIADIHVWFCTPGYWIYVFTALSTLTLTSCSYVLVVGLSLWS